MSPISMVTFDQRSANSLISRLITNRAEHTGSPLILAGEMQTWEKEKEREETRPNGKVGAAVTALSLSASSYS